MPLPQVIVRRLNALGLPFHGLATGGLLSLPNGDQKTAPGASGPSLVVQHPNAPGLSRTPEEAAQDTAEGKEWRTYGLLSGVSRYLGPQALGPGGWLYIDPAGTRWLLRAEFEAAATGSTSREYVITLVSRFGHLSEAGAPAAINRELYRETYTHTTPGSAFANPADYDDWTVYVIPNRDGSKLIGNVYTGPAPISGSFALEGRLVADLDEFAISGTGSLDVATLGNGIAATRTSRESYPQSITNPDESVSINHVIGAPSFDVTGSPGTYVVKRYLQDDPVTATVFVSNWDFCVGAIYNAAGVVQKVRKVTNQRTAQYTTYTGSGYYTCLDQASPGNQGPNFSGLSATMTKVDIEKIDILVGSAVAWSQQSGASVDYPLDVVTPTGGIPGTSGGCMCSQSDPVNPPPFGTPADCTLTVTAQSEADALADFAANHVPTWGPPEVNVQLENGCARIAVFPSEPPVGGLQTYAANGDSVTLVSGVGLTDALETKALKYAHNPVTGETIGNIDGVDMAFF